jgi:hypothetical protein
LLSRSGGEMRGLICTKVVAVLTHCRRPNGDLRALPALV